MSCFNGLLMGMGNPLLDISAEVGQDMLDKYEVQLDSAILAEDKHQPIYKDLVDNYNPKYIAGGATQNSIRVAQWMLSSAGMNDATAFMGCVGKDDFGVLVKGGERSLVTKLDAANNFKPSHLETPKAKEIIEAAKFYYIAGFFLTVSVESLKAVAEHAAAENKTFCLNLSAPFIIDFFGDQVAEAMPYADYLFCNESEAAAYAKKHELGDDLKEVALKVAALPKKNASRPRTVVFTQGDKSTIVARDGKVTEYAVEALSKDLLVDTNGAGDAFVGGFLSQLVQDKDIEAAVKAGHYAARHIIQVSGTQLDAECDYKA